MRLSEYLRKMAGSATTTTTTTTTPVKTATTTPVKKTITTPVKKTTTTPVKTTTTTPIKKTTTTTTPVKKTTTTPVKTTTTTPVDAMTQPPAEDADSGYLMTMRHEIGPDFALDDGVERKAYWDDASAKNPQVLLPGGIGVAEAKSYGVPEGTYKVGDVVPAEVYQSISRKHYDAARSASYQYFKSYGIENPPESLVNSMADMSYQMGISGAQAFPDRNKVMTSLMTTVNTLRASKDLKQRDQLLAQARKEIALIGQHNMDSEWGRKHTTRAQAITNKWLAGMSEWLDTFYGK